jgi:hypothetical protein
MGRFFGPEWMLLFVPRKAQFAADAKKLRDDETDLYLSSLQVRQSGWSVTETLRPNPRHFGNSPHFCALA